MTKNRQCKKLNECSEYEQAKLEWRSRTPQERGAILSENSYIFTPNIEIEVPVPFYGHVAVILSGAQGARVLDVKVSKRGVEKLRILYKSANKKGWMMRAGVGCVRFIRPGKLKLLVGVPTEWSSLWS